MSGQSTVFEASVTGSVRRARLPSRGYGRRDGSADGMPQARTMRERIEAAITTLAEDFPDRFPDKDAIVEYGDGFSKNRVYDNKDLMYAAQEEWNARQAASGRPTRRLRGGSGAVPSGWIAMEEHEHVRGQLARAIETILELKARNHRLSKSNTALLEDVARLEQDVYDEIWPVLDHE